MKIWMSIGLILLCATGISQSCDEPSIKLRIKQDESQSFTDYGISRMKSEYYPALIVILGETKTGVYTVETGINNDASDDHYARLVFSSFNGDRTEHTLFTEKEWANHAYEPDKHRSPYVKAKHRLKEFELTLLKPELTTTINKENISNSNATITYNTKSNGAISWHLDATPSMCWCFYEWNYSVSKP